MVDRIEEIVRYAERGQYERIAEAVVTRRDVDQEVPKYKGPEGDYRSVPAAMARFRRSLIPEDPLHIRTVVINPYKRKYPYRGVNFP